MRHVFIILSWTSTISRWMRLPPCKSLLIAAVCILLSSVGNAQSPHTTNGNRWALIMCGLPGDAEHVKRMTLATEQLVTGAEKSLHVDRSRIRVTAGDELMSKTLMNSVPSAPVTSDLTIQDTIKKISEQIAPDDSIWVFVVGHADIEGKAAHWNIQGTDPDMQKLSQWFSQIHCQQKIFWITTPVSGAAIRHLSGPGTVVISATDADFEINGTELPYVLSETLSGAAGAAVVDDRDDDGQISLLDLYIAVCFEIAQRFKLEKLLQTEHAILDDNGDKRGSELQQNFLPEDLGGRMKAGRRRQAFLDGSMAARILLPDIIAPKQPTVEVPSVSPTN